VPRASAPRTPEGDRTPALAGAGAPLDRNAQFLRGVGPRRADLLAKRLGLVTARDVLYHTPRRYLDASTVHRIRDLEPGMEATVVGRVLAKGVLPTRKGLRIFRAVLNDGSGTNLECAWIGQPWLDHRIRRGDLLLVTGTTRFYHGVQLQPREYEVLAKEGEESEGEAASDGAVFPVYPATEGLRQKTLRDLMAANLDELLAEVAPEEPFDRELLERIGLAPLERALEMAHRPASIAEVRAARRRLAFDELFFLQLLHAQTRHRLTAERPGIAFARHQTLVRPFYASLPFALTGAQRRVLAEIGEDMGAPQRMNRLLQGDVGAGKTVVALFAMLRAVENGYPAALMVPTEILAEQHLRTLERLLGELPVSVQLLTGRMGAAERRDALGRIASGEAQLVVGTHALIQDAVSYHRLGLVVVDEQHRFGVRQRLALSEMGDSADVLLMSATPIPRSLALTLYGDLDLSILDERPPGRQPIATGLRGEEKQAATWDFVRREIAAGRQAYVVYPLVEESEKVDLKSATDAYEQLRGEVFPELRLALLHGQMAGEEKDRTMRAFAAGEIDVLVATTVIEVGIDVPNATVMVIEHAERFGLSQLHQLRGRVGRGAERSYCVLLSSNPEAAERLRIFASTEDGFKIAEADMELRGQGDLFGDRQSGLPAFRYADLKEDLELLTLAREEARRIVTEDPTLASHPRMRAVLRTRYGDRARLYDVG
jgi:ATP-dependent DNA helicase RecG